MGRELTPEFRDEFVITFGKGNNKKEAILYNGMLALAHEDPRYGHIEAEIVQFPSGDNKWTAYAQARIYDKEGKCVGMEGADANAINCGKMTGAAFPRMALTRAKARAFRDFLNIAMVSADELGGVGVYEPERASTKQIGTIKRLGKKFKIKKEEMYDLMYDVVGVEEFNDLTPDEATAVINHIEANYTEEKLDEEAEF